MDRYSGHDRTLIHGSQAQAAIRRGVVSIPGIHPDDIPDLVQESHVKAWEEFAKFDHDKGDLAGWLYKMAKNHTKNHLRALSRQPGWRERESDRSGNWGKEWPTEIVVDVIADELPQTQFRRPDRQLEQHELFEAADGILSALDAGVTKRVFKLHVEGFTGREAASELGLSEDQAEYRLAQAREALNGGLRRKGFFPSKKTVSGKSAFLV